MCCIRLRVQKHHYNYLCTIVLSIELFDLRLCFMNTECVFRSCECVLSVINVLFMQQNLQTFV